jgi:hypothetical protein
VPSLLETIPIVVMSGPLIAVDGRTAVEADDAAAEVAEADPSISETRSEGCAVVARDAPVNAAGAGRVVADASSVGRAADMAFKFLRGCRTSEEATGREEGLGKEAGLETGAAVVGRVHAGAEEAKAWDATTGCVYMLRVATEVQGCTGMGMSMGTRKYSCDAI